MDKTRARTAKESLMGAVRMENMKPEDSSLRAALVGLFSTAR